MRLESGKVTEGRLIPAGGQIFRNSNLTGSFPTPTSVKDGTAPHLAHIVCSTLLYFQTKAAPGTFKTTLTVGVLYTYISMRFFIQKSLACARPRVSGRVVVVRGRSCAIY